MVWGAVHVFLTQVAIDIPLSDSCQSAFACFLTEKILSGLGVLLEARWGLQYLAEFVIASEVCMAALAVASGVQKVNPAQQSSFPQVHLPQRGDLSDARQEHQNGTGLGPTSHMNREEGGPFVHTHTQKPSEALYRCACQARTTKCPGPRAGFAITSKSSRIIGCNLSPSLLSSQAFSGLRGSSQLKLPCYAKHGNLLGLRRDAV